MLLILTLVRHSQKDKKFKVSLSNIESLGRSVSNKQINKQAKLTKFRHICIMLEVHGKDKQCTRRLPIPPECHQELSKNRLEQGHTSIRLRTNPNQTKLWSKSLARTWLREERPEKGLPSSYRSSSLQFFIHDIITAETNLRAAPWGHRRLPKGRSRFLFQFFPI